LWGYKEEERRVAQDEVKRGPIKQASAIAEEFLGGKRQERPDDDVLRPGQERNTTKNGVSAVMNDRDKGEEKDGRREIRAMGCGTKKGDTGRGGEPGEESGKNGISTHGTRQT